MNTFSIIAIIAIIICAALILFCLWRAGQLLHRDNGTPTTAAPDDQP